MEIVLIKRLLANGLATPESVRLEREFRGSDYWSAPENIEVTQTPCGSALAMSISTAKPIPTNDNDCAPALLVRDGDVTEVFTDFASFKRYVQPQTTNASYAEAACW